MNVLKFKAIKEGGGGRGEDREEEEEAVADVMAIQNPAVLPGMAQRGAGSVPVETGRRKGPLVVPPLNFPNRIGLKLPDDLSGRNSVPSFHL